MRSELHSSLSPCFSSQGLFRVAPSASKLKKLKASLDCGVLDVQEYSADPHAIAGELVIRSHQGHTWFYNLVILFHLDPF